ncbi:MAG: flagellar basal-body rod protein FlgG [Candidatus Thiodiazotropha sp. (ex Dulcina madagascariensis)]|nr:flagellar basal-body rod protein FlgG [Candidatus Thiodiazotropha sp. (ex Dulcina madagascariensis)]MCU7925831.1 flagellar basal-body rod protein FlgG [Candidatus Thiodiazotropha sp. (ex Dulcina madagascariensis)]
MLESMSIAATGMHAQQLTIDVVANNLANANTMGFKKSRIDFEDLVYRAAHPNKNGLINPDIMQPFGTGTALLSVGKVFDSGELKKTERSLDIALQGEGFLEVIMPDGSYGYTRAGSLKVDKDGMLTNMDGHALSSLIQMPEDTQNIIIDKDGKVFIEIVSEDDPLNVGQIELSKFVNPMELTPMGSNLYKPSDASGDALYGTAGNNGFASIEQGYLEASNVSLVEELTNLMMAQRAYELNSKVIQASDEILGIVNGLRR